MGRSDIFKETHQVVLPSSLSSLGQVADKLIVKQHQPYMNYRDAVAFGYIYGLLSSLSMHSQTCFRDTQIKAANIFCIGGPAVNAASKRAFDLAKNYLAFQATQAGEFALVNRTTGKNWIYCPDQTDYGVILKVGNPACTGKCHIVFAGIWGWGTAGSAYYFVQNLRHISKMFGKRSFGLILEISIPHTHQSAKQVDLIEIA